MFLFNDLDVLYDDNKNIVFFLENVNNFTSFYFHHSNI